MLAFSITRRCLGKLSVPRRGFIDRHCWRRNRRDLYCLSHQLSVMSSSTSTQPLPVVVILGCTASGKSKLAIDLAKHVGGEVISADSMQVYHGLDILTNKASVEEMGGVPHHMISVVNRSEKFDVVRFRDLALPLVQDLLTRGKVPFIVGGTNYYIESLLYKVLINESPSASKFPGNGTDTSDGDNDNNSGVGMNAKRAKMDSGDAITTSAILTFMEEKMGNFEEEDVVSKWSVNELHAALRQVDEPRALKLHPNDVRKVVRSLQVYFRTGRKHSEIIEEQCVSTSSDEDVTDPSDNESLTPNSLTPKLGGPLRFPNVICFWIQCDRSILNARIEKRVDQMVDLGLQDELNSYIDKISKENRKWDTQQGQLQSIGVKEFHDYIQLPPEERNSENGKKLFNDGLDRLKIVTRQYAKRQRQWISQRFLKSSRRQLPIVYGLDGNKTDSSSWGENVIRPAIEILEAHLQGKESSVQKEKKVTIEENTDDEEDFVARTCEVCNKLLMGSIQWQIHMKSSKHWKIVKRKKKEMERAKVLSSKGAANSDQLIKETGTGLQELKC